MVRTQSGRAGKILKTKKREMADRTSRGKKKEHTGGESLASILRERASIPRTKCKEGSKLKAKEHVEMNG